MTKDPEQMMQEAYECLDSFDADNALSIGKELVEMRFSGGFEIIALSYAMDDKLDKAIKTLEEGVRSCPTVWILWQLLGNYYSDDERYDKAMECYHKALECEEADPSSVHLNIAISLSRQQKFNESNQELLLVDDQGMAAPREAMRMGNYLALKRYDDVISEAPRVMASLDFKDDEEKYQHIKNDLSALYAHFATALIEGKQDAEAAKAAAFNSLHHDKTNQKALSILREINAQKADEGDRLFRIVVEGQWHEPFEGEDELPKFYTSYWAIASSETEAMTFAQAIEPPEVAQSLRLDSWEQEKPEDWQTFKGVYSRAGYAFYEQDEEED